MSYPLAPAVVKPRQLAPTVGPSGAVWIKFGRDRCSDPGTLLRHRPRISFHLVLGYGLDRVLDGPGRTVGGPGRTCSGTGRS